MWVKISEIEIATMVIDLFQFKQFLQIIIQTIFVVIRFNMQTSYNMFYKMRFTVRRQKDNVLSLFVDSSVTNWFRITKRIISFKFLLARSEFLPLAVFWNVGNF